MHAAEGGNDASEHVNELFKWINFAVVAARIDLDLRQSVATDFPQAIRRDRGGDQEGDRSQGSKPTGSFAKPNRNSRSSNRKSRSCELIAQREAAAEAERIRNATLSDAEKIEAAAAAEIEAAERAARLELKALAANLAVDSAESLLAKQLTPQAQEALVSAFVKGLAGRPN